MRHIDAILQAYPRSVIYEFLRYGHVLSLQRNAYDVSVPPSIFYAVFIANDFMGPLQELYSCS